MADARFKGYKNRGLNAQEMRRRREEEGVQIRKSKREEEITKRRNVGPSVDKSDSIESSQHYTVHVGTGSIPEIVQAVYSTEPETQLAGTLALRKTLSQPDNPPIDEVVSTGVVPRLVEFVHSHENTAVQLDAAWSLTNIASGSSLQTRVVVEAGAVPIFVEALSRGNNDVIEQVIWGLGNIAGDGPDCRDYVIQNRALTPLLDIMAQAKKLSMLRNSVWAVSNLCRGKNPRPDFATVKACIPVFARLLYHQDENILRDVCWTFSFLSDGNNGQIQALIDAGVCRRLVELLQCETQSILSPVLRTVGNIVTGDDVQTQVMLNCHLLPSLFQLLSSEREHSIRKEACWTLSNITAGNRVQIQAAIDSNIMLKVVEKLSDDEFKVRKEALWAVSNAVSGGSPLQIKYLVDIGFIKPICDMLTVVDASLIKVTLDTLDAILLVGQQASKRNNGVNEYATLIEEAHGLDKLEYLQGHDNEEVHTTAFELIEKYFQDEDDKEGVAQERDGEMQFNADGVTPEGGFNFQ